MRDWLPKGKEASGTRRSDTRLSVHLFRGTETISSSAVGKGPLFYLLLLLAGCLPLGGLGFCCSSGHGQIKELQHKRPIMLVRTANPTRWRRCAI